MHLLRVDLLCSIYHTHVAKQLPNLYRNTANPAVIVTVVSSIEIIVTRVLKRAKTAAVEVFTVVGPPRRATKSSTVIDDGNGNDNQQSLLLSSSSIATTTTSNYGNGATLASASYCNNVSAYDGKQRHVKTENFGNCGVQGPVTIDDKIYNNRQIRNDSTSQPRGLYFIESSNDETKKSPRDVEESRTDNEEELTEGVQDEREGFLFGGRGRKCRRRFLFARDTIKKTRPTPKPARLVAKNGECLIRPVNQPNKLLNTYKNWFHLLIEISWRNVLLIFAAGFVGSWLFFGALYYFIVQYYSYYIDEVRRFENHQCITNVHTFLSAFLFSLESQHTIGYGHRYMTEMCAPAYFVLCVQLIVGVLAQTLLAGIIIAKILRPKKRKQEMRFSRCAVVAWPMDEDDDELVTNPAPYGLSRAGQVADQLSIASLTSVARRGSCVSSKVNNSIALRSTTRFGAHVAPVADSVSQAGVSAAVTECGAYKPVLMIRLADVQHRLYLAESHVRLYMAITKINSKGEKELIGIRDMNVGYDNGTDRVLLLWPVLIRHIIDEDSPFYGMTPEKARTSTDFELIMTIEGIVEATGMTFQARTSFLPSEIKWGQRFVPIVTMNAKTNNYEVDYSLFDESKPSALPPEMCETPLKKRSVATNPPKNLFATTIDELSTAVTANSIRSQLQAHGHEREDRERMRLNDVRKISDSNAVIASAAVNYKSSFIPAIDGEDDPHETADTPPRKIPHSVHLHKTTSRDDDSGRERDGEDAFCTGGDANADDDAVGERPLLLMHATAAHSASGGGASHHASGGAAVHHHHFHQRHRHHSSSGFT